MLSIILSNFYCSKIHSRACSVTLALLSIGVSKAGLLRERFLAGLVIVFCAHYMDYGHG